jgi:hypothetical protein
MNLFEARPNRARVAGALLAAGLVVVAMLWLDRGSLERGNRLYRAGEISSAEEIYRTGWAAPNGPSIVSYNLGTSLLALGSDSASHHLRLAAESADSASAQRAYYNLGYIFLTSVQPSTPRDSAVPLLVAAVGANRAALRLDPTDENARWNLALAQRQLDSFRPPLKESSDAKKPREKDTEYEAEIEPETDVLGSTSNREATQPKENADAPKPGDGAGQRQAVVTGGESEAVAGQDPGPLTKAAAMQLVRNITDTPEQLVRGLLWSHRPNSAWWESQPFPGGNW